MPAEAGGPIVVLGRGRVGRSLAAVDLAVRCGLETDRAARVESALTARVPPTERRLPE